MGGFLSASLLVRHPERLRSVILAGIGDSIVTGALLSSARTNGIADAMEAKDGGASTDETARGFRVFAERTGNDLAALGTSIENPDIEYHKLAQSMGWWAKGPIKDPAELGPAIKEAVAVVKSGQPALLNVWTQPR